MALPAENVARFLEFMQKREMLRITKENGAPWPWSDDIILNTYKFTNVKREHDRTTRWMRANWTGPHHNAPAGEIIFNCALFRYFGTSEFAEAIGWQSPWDAKRVAKVASERRDRGQRVFTGAYIIPTIGFRGRKSDVVCREILAPLWNAREDIAAIALSTRSWRATGERLMEQPGFGGTGFMTKEVMQDVMQTPVLHDAIDRDTWCPVGPGAQRGLNRLSGRLLSKRTSFETSLSEMIELFVEAKGALSALTPAPPSLW
jgi:hypothetical protein